MMKWSHTLLAGSAIILLTNAVALGGAGYNRSGEPESLLYLTQRELNLSYSGRDNCGLTLALNWRFERSELNDYDFGMYSGNWGVPAWLNQAKMAQLGFDVEKLVATSEYGRRYKEFQPKEMLLVLELDGPAYQRNLQHIREYVEESRKLLAASPANAEMQRKAKTAEDNFRHERDKGSRLYVIDAGRDMEALRAAYPDRNRHAIVHGLIRPTTISVKDKPVIGGNISELHAGSINVPLKFRQAFGDRNAYEATVAFGRRLEPWIVVAAKGVAPTHTENK